MAEQNQAVAQSAVPGNAAVAVPVAPEFGPRSFRGLNKLSLFRQLGLLVGLAGSVALGVAMVLWSQEPSYRLLFGGLGDRDLSEIASVLDQSGIPYRLDQNSQAVMVPDSSVHAARLKLAAQGLPQSTRDGFELMEKNSGFGTSQFMETARYHRALESELARTISSIRGVDKARVHLAIPRQSVFIGSGQQPSASVMLSLFSGRRLNEGQVAAIVNLVASSVPSLPPERVAVVDQAGHLLTGRERSDLALAQEQLVHGQRLEDLYRQRISDILIPVLGDGRFRAQVAVSLDHTVIEETREDYQADPAAIRSERLYEQRRGAAADVQGVPGALSNQPPGAGQAPEVAGAGANGTNGGAAAAARNENTNRESTRNFELDRTISYSRTGPGRLKRLSVAVVVDDAVEKDKDGKLVRKPRTEQEIARFVSLVREAVGFSEARGDTVQVVNSSFYETPAAAAEPLPDEPIWKQPWVWDIGKQALGVLGVLLLIFAVLRPAMRNLATRAPQPAAAPAQGMMLAGPGQAALPASDGALGQMLSMTSENDYDTELQAAKQLVAEDPKRVAQVVKTWLHTDG